jgi:hypothetical protein
MKSQKPICITFAGVIGSSKTPIANYLSCKLGLSIFNNDAIRSEVAEDLGFSDEAVQEERRNKRLEDLLQSQLSFICDASVDRGWNIFKQKLSEYGYDWFIISLDLSKEKLVEFYKIKNYQESLLVLDQYFSDHDRFIKENKKDIGISIDDSKFSDRLKLSYEAVSNNL